MKKEEKQSQAEALRRELERAKGVLLSGFEGLTVAQDTQLRDRIAKAGGTYRVVKNSLIERAAQGTPVAPVAQKLRGTTSLAYTETDPVAMAPPPPLFSQAASVRWVPPAARHDQR